MKSPLDNAIQKKLEEIEKKVGYLNDNYPGANDAIAAALRDIIREYREGTRVKEKDTVDCCQGTPGISCGCIAEDWNQALSEMDRKSQEWCGEDK